MAGSEQLALVVCFDLLIHFELASFVIVALLVAASHSVEVCSGRVAGKQSIYTHLAQRSGSAPFGSSTLLEEYRVQSRLWLKEL